MDNMKSSILAALLISQDKGYQKKKPLSKRQLKAQVASRKIGRVIGVIAGVAVAVAMIVMFCS